jgi:hypothetical protein
MFPKWSELVSLWKAWKAAFFSEKAEDKTKAWGGVIAAFSFLVVLLAGFGLVNTVFLVALVLTLVKLVSNFSDKP